MEYDNTNTGVFFRKDKEGNEKRPDYKGTLNVEGKEYEIAGWKRMSKAGKPFVSLKISEPFEKKEQSGYDSFKQAGEKFKKDEVIEPTENEISLADIPFN